MAAGATVPGAIFFDMSSFHPTTRSTVLITGAAGRVASRMAPFLADRYHLRLTDLRSGEVSGMPVERLDLRDPDRLTQALAGVNAVVHSAIARYSDEELPAGSPEMHDYFDRMIEVNIRGIYHLYEAARLQGVGCVVLISSLTVLLGHERSLVFDREGLYPKSSNLYGCTKLFGESVGELYSRLYGIRTIVLRLGQPYPLGIAKEQQWIENPRSRSIFVSHRDIARAVDAALTAENVPFGAYSIVGKQERETALARHAREIGFEPVDSFCREEAALSAVP